MRMKTRAARTLLLAVMLVGGLPAGPSAWADVPATQQAKLTASDASALDAFGASVAMSGDTVVVGAPRHDRNVGIDSGSAYVFVRSGTTWIQQAKLTASDASALDAFGYSVAISGDTLLVGALVTDPGSLSGSAYVFARSGTTWIQQAKLTTSDRGVSNSRYSDGFGTSVAISGDTAVVGTPQHDGDAGQNSGSVFVFAPDPT